MAPEYANDAQDAPVGVAPMDPAEAQKRAKALGEVQRDYALWSQHQRAHHGTWFVNAAFLRGQQHVRYDDINARLVTPDTPSYAVQIDLNKILPKHRARMAKKFKNRPKPVVMPASHESHDIMSARASEYAIRYQMDRLRLETLYREAAQWASVTGKAYWWISYDPTVIGQVKMQDEYGQEMTVDAEVGDMALDVGNAFEVFPSDPTIATIGKQPKFIRAQTILRSEALRRFPDCDWEEASGGKYLDGDDTEERIASLSANTLSSASVVRKRTDRVTLLEHYTAPCGDYPRGRCITVCGDKLVKYEEELPFGFWRSTANPYPCVEFSDTGLVGQFFNTTWIEQLIPIQRALNYLWECVLENIRAVSRPKIIVYKQHQLPEGAWTNSAGEVVELNWYPQLPPPQIIQAANVSGDVWNLMNVLIRQIDDVSQIHTASEGGGASQSSGYQTNLLQEATDAVHGPDIRSDELAIEDWAWKARRMMKELWDVPRLLAVQGEGSLTDVQEFSQHQINEHAEVRIQIGSMLPDLKAAKAQTILNWAKEGMLGDPTDPNVRRKIQAAIDMAGFEDVNEAERRDVDSAFRENQTIKQGGVLKPAQWFENHALHAAEHETFMKTAEFAALPDAARLELIKNDITHYDFLNPQMAQGLRQQHGLMDMPIASPPPPPQAPAGPPAPPAPLGPPA